MCWAALGAHFVWFCREGAAPSPSTIPYSELSCVVGEKSRHCYGIISLKTPGRLQRPGAILSLHPRGGPCHERHNRNGPCPEANRSVFAGRTGEWISLQRPDRA